MLLGGLLVVNLTRSDNKPDVFTVGGLVPKEPVNPVPVSPIHRSWVGEIGGESAQFEYELVEDTGRDS